MDLQRNKGNDQSIQSMINQRKHLLCNYNVSGFKLPFSINYIIQKKIRFPPSIEKMENTENVKAAGNK